MNKINIKHFSVTHSHQVRPDPSVIELALLRALRLRRLRRVRRLGGRLLRRKRRLFGGSSAASVASGLRWGLGGAWDDPGDLGGLWVLRSDLETTWSLKRTI